MFDAKKKRLIKDPWRGSCGVYLEAIEIVEASVFELRFSWSYIKSLIKAIPSAPDSFSMIVAARMEGE
jgi:hypothetical protein